MRLSSDELKELLSHATPGPWGLGDEKKVAEIWNVEVLGHQGHSLVSTCYGTTTGLADWYAGASEVKANARLIALAPQLAADNIALQAEVERLREALLPFAEDDGMCCVNSDYAAARAALNT